MLNLDQATITIGDFRLTADLSFPTGLTAIVGPSGGGKSTLLAALAGFQDLTAGRVLWQTADITHHAPGDRPIAMLFQDNNLFPHLTVAQNVGLALHPSLRLTADDRTRVDHALDQVGLAGLGQRKPAALSGGQQSRAALARVLLADKPVILLDEPFAALGPGLKAEMLALVDAILKDPARTVIMVTHNPDDALSVADQVVFIGDGVAMPPVPTQELFSNPPAALRTYLGRA